MPAILLFEALGLPRNSDDDGGGCGCALRSLSLSGLELSAEAAAALGASLRRGAPLEALHLSSGGAAADGASLGAELAAALLLAPAAGHVAQLRSLRLGDCRLGDEGARCCWGAAPEPRAWRLLVRASSLWLLWALRC